jgi:hypothetical protein
MEKIKYTMLYRDGANYKTYIVVATDRVLEMNEEITTEELLEMSDREFSEAYVGTYDEQFDHNILEVVEFSPVADADIVV